ncbi:hypothetical protein GCM10027586_18290 [Kineococcus gypseus]|uniref:hypothetical protein n=1 Tax=Kineococcus gypseus TaxID=1637102 RepID=UPI003D7E8D8B
MIEPRIVQRLRDAAEDHRVRPEAPVRLELLLADGRSLTGAPLAVEDGAVWVQTGPDEDAAVVELETVLDLRDVDVCGADVRELDLRGPAVPAQDRGAPEALAEPTAG